MLVPNGRTFELERKQRAGLVRKGTRPAAWSIQPGGGRMSGFEGRVSWYDDGIVVQMPTGTRLCGENGTDATVRCAKQEIAAGGLSGYYGEDGRLRASRARFRRMWLTARIDSALSPRAGRSAWAGQLCADARPNTSDDS